MNATDPQHRPSGPEPERSSQGLRSRIVAPTPPAPVPEVKRKPQPASPAEVDRSNLSHAPGQAPSQAPTLSTPPGRRTEANTATAIDAPEQAEETTDGDVVRSTGSMAVATLISRITGFLRTVLLGSSLGTAVGSAFGTANTLPNLITEVVLGAVLTSLVVPVLVRAEKEDPDRGAAFIRRLFTLAFSLLTVITLLAVAAAPLLTQMLVRKSGEVNITQSISFAYWLLPQIFFYGLFSLFMAILNTKGVFRPGAWAPVANNIISIAVLLLYQFVPGRLSDSAPSGPFDPHVMLLGLGTTLGVVMQLLIMVPPLRKAGVDLRPLWGIDDRLKEFGGMAVAIIVYVAISQLGYSITSQIASGSSKAAPLIYQNHWLLLQVPYGIIGVTLLTAIMPRLSRKAAEGDDRGVVDDLTLGTKLTFIALIPIVVFFTAFGQDIAFGLFRYGHFDPHSASVLGLTLSFSAFTLIPYALVLLHLRVFYAREEAWTPTFIIAGITVTKIVLSYLAPSVASSPDRVVVLLGAANGFGFVAGAVIGAMLLRRKLGPLGAPTIMRTSLWAFGASLVGVFVAAVASILLGRLVGPEALGSLWVLVRLCVIGVVFLVVTGVVLSFSRLPEVQNLGAVAQRIPGMNRLIRTDPERQIQVDAPTQQELSTQFIGSDTFNASPVPPPMSAGVVRGPRLVPGAPVSDGRFRLLVDHGSVTGAQFWQAKEQATGRLVALVFVDTSGTSPMAPVSPAAAAGAASEVARRTRALAALGHPAIAPNIEVSAYRSGCLVVADWVEGTSLKEISRSEEIHPRAAAYALAPLVHATAAADALHTPLGLDNWGRIRITTSGTAVLAFPAVLSSASTAQDLDALAWALNLLIDEDAPADVQAAKQKVEAAATLAADENASAQEREQIDAAGLRELSEELRQAGLAETPSSSADTSETAAVPSPSEQARRRAQALSVPAESTPQVEERPGFGAKSMTRSGTAGLGVIVFAAVIALAVTATYVASVIGGEDGSSPVNPGSSHTSEVAPPQIQPLSGINVWQATGSEGQSDHPQDVNYAVDGNPTTSWSSDEYPQGFGNKPGVGLLVRLQNPIQATELEILSSAPGSHAVIYAIPSSMDSAELEENLDLSTIPLVAEGTLGEGTTALPLASTSEPAQALVVWFDAVSPQTHTVSVSNMSILGTKVSRNEATTEVPVPQVDGGTRPTQ
ncbi:murein biosynthesis integral membrane protein MurJ [Corynebacterium lowii]|uniref:Putative peptidoglycan biosynthesis protein MviN n=1 Tax=Corynebacterium lowii TaxID=1544413 RepID=A0A0Q0UFV5_9CORY|nr:murein biosynthesis integral membrane protein MurJ [Corynebacterium lowii]KQB87022.1 putative peptidoglycan biosynthesis protein MviN [Corynebacterium lowii]MDP9852397.1 putative peptidoglycan lipid II flippase [Corynebacterium lowii]